MTRHAYTKITFEYEQTSKPPSLIRPPSHAKPEVIVISLSYCVRLLYLSDRLLPEM